MSKIYMATRDDVTTIGNKLAASWEGDLEAAYTAIANAGGTVPVDKTIAGLAAAIATIPGDRLEGLIENTGINTLNSSATTVRGYAFYGTTTLQSVALPNATTIGQYAFYNIQNLRNLIVPNVINIEGYAFASSIINYTMDELSLPNLITLASVGYTFSGCTSLKKASFPVASSIPQRCFIGCSNLETVEFASCTNIGQNCFEQCSKLSRITAPNAKTIVEQWNASLGISGGQAVLDVRNVSSSDFTTNTAFLGGANIRQRYHIWFSDGWYAYDSSSSSWVLNAYPDPNHADSPAAS